MYALWNEEVRFPAIGELKQPCGVEFVSVHTAVDGAYQFLLGAAVIRHGDRLVASWGNSYRSENDENTVLAQRISEDGGKTWTDYRRISRVDAGIGRSHGVFLEQDGRLYAFCPRAEYRLLESYPNLKMEGYFQDGAGAWEEMGVVLDDAFWPMCEPIRLAGGSLLMAGLCTKGNGAAVALCDGVELGKWEMRLISNPHGFSYWGETTVLKRADRLLAIVRGGRDAHCALVSESLDGGNTWSGLERSNLPIANSKMYAGVLSNGLEYLVFNMRGEQYRDTLCIAAGRGSFERIYLLRHGFEAPPAFQKNNQWCYPYAYEDAEKQLLYVIYAKNKEDCELAILPIHALTR